MTKFERILKLKKNNFEIDPNPCWIGYEPIGLKPDGSPNCVPTKDQMKKIVKEGFPIPSPSSDEDENTFISRCVSSIIDEYGQEQSLGICYSTWRDR